jgi:hypothetical protein
MVTVEAGEVRVGVRVMMVVAARVGMRPVGMLVRGVARRSATRWRCRGGLDGVRLVAGLGRVVPGWRLVARRARERDQPERADHGFFLGGIAAIFCLSAASSSSSVDAGFFALARALGRGSAGELPVRRLSASS